MEQQNVLLSVSDYIALTNQTLEYAQSAVEIEGEVSGFKVNQGKYVFFDLKDSESSLSCFMMVFQLRIPIEDGMRVVVRARPKLTKWGKFSLTIEVIRPIGEGSLRKSFELLKARLEKEGLFSLERKRPLPSMPSRIAVISSTQAAGYQDFMKILGDRWGAMVVSVAHVQVQGEAAPDQIISAIEFFNQQTVLPEVIVIVRGGGSADDLACFNDELLVRAVAASRVPVLTGIGHEIDVCLVDMAADRRAATPTNAAQIVVPDRYEVIRGIRRTIEDAGQSIERALDNIRSEKQSLLDDALSSLEYRVSELETSRKNIYNTLQAYDPRRVLERGYSIIKGEAVIGETIEIQSVHQQITAKVLDVKEI